MAAGGRLPDGHLGARAAWRLAGQWAHLHLHSKKLPVERPVSADQGGGVVGITYVLSFYYDLRFYKDVIRIL